MYTRVKFCGITSAKDAAAAAAAGADAIGMVFYPPAAVAVEAAAAAEICRAVPPFVSTVALFVNAAADEVHSVIDTVKPHFLQFHGDEEAAFCRQFGVPYLRACRVQTRSDIEKAIAAHPDCSGLLLDSYVPGVAGGSGSSFDWRQIPADCPVPLIVAGGLTADNVAGLIQQIRPWGVDVSSGIAEADNRRRKNWDKMTAFIRNTKNAELS